MAQIDDLNAAIAAEDVELTDVAASVTQISADVDKLLAAAQNGTPPADLTAQIAKIQAHTAALATAVTQLKSEDQKVNPSTTPPPAAS